MILANITLITSGRLVLSPVFAVAFSGLEIFVLVLMAGGFGHAAVSVCELKCAGIFSLNCQLQLTIQLGRRL